MTRLLVILSVILCCVVPAAQASVTPLGTPLQRVQADVTHAEQYFDAMPACGTPQIIWNSVLPADVESDTQAWVVYPGDSCQIHILRGWVRSQYAGVTCRLIAHEFSHLLGYWDDNTVPGTLFAHEITAQTPDPECNA